MEHQPARVENVRFWVELHIRSITMNTTTGKTKRKRPSKGQRKHNRLVKQEARKASVPGNDTNQRKRPS
jgi:hypothetical protein